VLCQLWRLSSSVDRWWIGIKWLKPVEQARINSSASNVVNLDTLAGELLLNLGCDDAHQAEARYGLDRSVFEQARTVRKEEYFTSYIQV